MDVELYKNTTSPYLNDLFSSLQESSFMGDSLFSLSPSLLDEFKEKTYSEIQAQYISAGIKTSSLSEAQSSVSLSLQNITGDGDILYNSRSGIGTFNDPSLFTSVGLPLMISPHEESSLYASGGLPAQIIDRKGPGLVEEGVFFISDDEYWDMDKLKKLAEVAELTGFNEKIAEALRDSLVCGGSILYPIFNNDRPSSIASPLKNYEKLDKDCIHRWVEVDRWNLMSVPSLIITTPNFIDPPSYLVPATGIEVNAERACIFRPASLPYWSAILNLGWCPSDFTGWMRAYYGYAITMQAVPTMAQQSSLLLYRMPLDALNATIGSDNVERLMAINEKKMSEWSVVNPKAVNMIGEVEAINRTYSGMENLFAALKANLAAECGVAEPILWHTPNKGFSDNTQESLIKQSDLTRKGQKMIVRTCSRAKDIIAIHTFGKEVIEHLDTLKMSLTPPHSETPLNDAEIIARFAASIASLTSAGMSPSTALELTKKSFPSVEITNEVLEKVEKEYKETQEREEKMTKEKLQMGAKMGNNSTSPGNYATTGHNSKPKPAKGGKK